MAPKNSLLPDPPTASSSEDEEVESGEEEEEVKSGEEEEEEAGEEEEDDEDEGESESNEEEPTPKRPEPVVSKPESSSSGEDDDSDEDGSEKDDESESDEIPVKSKPSVAEEPKPKKTVSKPSSSTAPAIAVVPVSQKRPAESEQAENDSKKKKKKKADEANGEGGIGEKIDPKKLFARVWSDDDEVVILKGMMKWHEKGDDPFADLGGFLDFIKESVHAAVKQDQLLNKMRRLKKKYQNNFKRGKGGLDPIFSKPRDSKCYELMKVIWGGEEVSSRKKSAPADNDNEESAPTANGKSRSSKPKTTTPVSPKQKTVALSDISSKEPPKEVQEGNASAYPLLAAAFGDMKNSPTVGESLFKEGLALLGDSKAKEMENKWRKLHQEEAEIYLKRVEQVRELTATVLNAMKSSDA